MTPCTTVEDCPYGIPAHYPCLDKGRCSNDSEVVCLSDSDCPDGSCAMEGEPNKVLDSHGTVGGGMGNIAGSDDGDTVSDICPTVSGGYWNTAAGGNSTVSGGGFNTASAGYSTVGGGWANSTTGSGHSTVGGGSRNDALGTYATVAGGDGNQAESTGSAIGGGQGNTAWAVATVAGGHYNHADGVYSAIGGGSFNTAEGRDSTIPGGERNFAGGQHSFAAGYQAKVRSAVEAGEDPEDCSPVCGDEGTFVWSDSTSESWVYFTSTGPNQFLIQATGGVGIGTDNPGGFQLAVDGSAAKPGGGSWSVFSDRRLKKGVQPVTGALERLLELRGVTFEYKDPGLKLGLPGRQIGLIAQEVEEVFPEWVGEDPDGYKYVTVRGLEALVVEALRELREEKDAEISELECERDAQQDRIANLEERLAALEMLMNHADAGSEGGAR